MACYRYRGLASFRTSPWDKDEELPADYQRIYRQGNIKLLKKKIMKTELTNSVAVSRTQGRSDLLGARDSRDVVMGDVFSVYMCFFLSSLTIMG